MSAAIPLLHPLDHEGVQVHRARDPRHLRALLAELLARDPLPLFAEELLVVSSGLAATWLTAGIAERVGIAAQLSFPFLGDHLRSLPYEGPEFPAPDAAVLTAFRCLRRLAAGADADSALAAAAEADPSGQRLMAYASLATRWLDRLGRHRGGGDLAAPGLPTWLAPLERELAAEQASALAAWQALDRALVEGFPRPNAPSRVHLFAPHTLVARDFDRFLRLHAEAQVHLWFDVPTELLLPAPGRRGRIEDGPQPELLRSFGTRLLEREALLWERDPEGLLIDAAPEAGMASGAEAPALEHEQLTLFDLDELEDDAEAQADLGGALSSGPTSLDDLLDTAAGAESDFASEGVQRRGGLLLRLQEDLAELRDRELSRLAQAASEVGSEGGAAGAGLLAGPTIHDPSLEVHVVPGLARTAQALADRILAALDADPSLTPADIAVACEDPEALRTVLDAAFRSLRAPRSLALSFPRHPSGEEALLGLWQRLASLRLGRATVEEVLAVLECEAVRRRFGLRIEDLAVLRRWCAEARIRWGFDAADRSRRIAGAADGHSSIERGLDRMLLSVVLGADEGLFGGVGGEPTPAFEDPELLGRFADAIAVLRRTDERLARAQDGPSWSALLLSLRGELFELESEEEMRAYTRWMSAARDLAALPAGELLPGPALGSWVAARLAPAHPSPPELGRGIVVGRPLDLFGVPFRVMAVLGCDDGGFPGTGESVAFGALPGDPAAGDPDPKADDEAFLFFSVQHVQDSLWFFRSGRSLDRGEPIAPSRGLALLCEHVVALVGDGGLVARTRVHPDLSFHARRFAEGLPPAWQSYAREAAAQSAELACSERRARPLVDAVALPPAEGSAGAPSQAEAPLSLDLAELVRFWRNPAAAYARHTLGIAFPEADEDDPDEHESFQLEAFDRAVIAGPLTREGAAIDLLAAQARDRLPAGRAEEEGRRELTDLDFVLRRNAGAAWPTQAWEGRLDLEGEGLRLAGRCTWRLGPQGPVWLSASGRLPAKTVLQAWILWCAGLAAEGGPPPSAGHDSPPCALLIGRDQTLRLAAPSDPAAVLLRLATGARQGLDAEQGPVAFFPDTSRERAKHGPDESFGQLLTRRFELDRDGGMHLAVQLIWRDRDPLAEAAGFGVWAERVWEPISAAEITTAKPKSTKAKKTTKRAGPAGGKGSR